MHISCVVGIDLVDTGTLAEIPYTGRCTDAARAPRKNRKPVPQRDRLPVR